MAVDILPENRWQSTLTRNRGQSSFERVQNTETSLIKTNYKAVLFDLDGTLIDHFRIIYRSYCFAVGQLGVAAATFEQLKAAVGGAVPITFGKLMPQEYVEDAVRLFREEFDRIWHEDITVLPGAAWLLAGLHARGCQLAVFTNKEGDRARRILRHIELDGQLDAVFGTLDTPWRKPQPEFTRHVLGELGADAAHACMIGDSPYDVEAAKVAGLAAYVVATGSHTMAELSEHTQADGVYMDLYALGAEVFGLPLPDGPRV